MPPSDPAGPLTLPLPPYRPTKEDSLLLMDNGDNGEAVPTARDIRGEGVSESRGRFSRSIGRAHALDMAGSMLNVEVVVYTLRSRPASVRPEICPSGEGGVVRCAIRWRCKGRPISKRSRKSIFQFWSLRFRSNNTTPPLPFRSNLPSGMCPAWRDVYDD